MSVLTIVMPETTNDLTSLAVIKQRFNIVNSTADANLEAWISDASDAIATALHRKLGARVLSEDFSSQTDLYGFDGHDQFRGVFGQWGYQQLVLAQRPVTDIASVLDENGDIIDPSLYIWTGEEGILRLSNNRPRTFSPDPLWPHGKITVAYSAGYVLPNGVVPWKTPRSLQRACIRLVAHYRAAEVRDPYMRSVDIPGIMTKSYWVGTPGENGALPPEVLDLIMPFRDIAV